MSYPSAEKQSVYSTAPAVRGKFIYIRKARKNGVMLLLLVVSNLQYCRLVEYADCILCRRVFKKNSQKRSFLGMAQAVSEGEAHVLKIWGV